MIQKNVLLQDLEYFQAGRLVESGCRDRLIAENGLYAELWAKQPSHREA